MAVTGLRAVDYTVSGFETLEAIKSLLNCSEEEVVERIAALINQRKKLEKELKQQRFSKGGDQLSLVVQSAQLVDGKNVAIARVDADDMEHLKLLGDQLRSLLKSGVGVIGAVLDGKPSIAFVVTDDLVKTGIKATDFIEKVGKELGGGGGGKPHFATAGGKDSKRLDGALKAAKKLITANL